MSLFIQWAVPDKYEVGPDPDVRKVIVQKQTGGFGPFVQIAEIDATSDGAAKSSTNTWISEYEDASGTVNDMYQVAFKDAGGKIGTFSVPGAGGYLSRIHEVMDLVRMDLGDINPAFYQLDAITQYKWTGTQLYMWLRAAINDFNGSGAMVTNYTWDTLPEDAIPVIEESVKCRALFERATKEIANVLDYNDGVSFKITNRPADYRAMKDEACRFFMEKVKMWKLSHRPRAIGLGSQRLPFRVTRPLSMLPNMANTFGL
jgi:hypothetical protein